MVAENKITFKIDRLVHNDDIYFVASVLGDDKEVVDTLYAYSLHDALKQLKKRYGVDIRVNMGFANRKLDEFLIWYKKISNRYLKPEEIEKLREKFV